MTLFGFFKRSRQTAISDPELLKEALFDAAGSANRRRFVQLCRTNQSTIAQQFRSWQKAPDEILADRSALLEYAKALIVIAEYFAQSLGDASLVQSMEQPQSVAAQWPGKLKEARSLMDACQFEEAGQLLSDLIIDVRNLRPIGSKIEPILPATHASLGECFLQQCFAEKAIPHLQKALSLCEETNDGPGILRYLEMLYEAHRYLGQHLQAASFAERLGESFTVLGNERGAARFRRLAAIVRAGEPLLRVVAEVDQDQYELDEVPLDNDGRMPLLFVRNRMSLRRVGHLIAEATNRGKAGDLEAALQTLRAAAAADPFDPRGHYESATILMMMGRWAEAAASYQAADVLAPGWFHTRLNRWLAQQLALGNMDPEILVVIRKLEYSPLEPTQKVAIAEAALERAAQVPYLHLLHGQSLAELHRNQEAQSAYREGLACNPEPDVKTRLLVQMALLTDSLEERRRLDREAVLLNGNLISAAVAYLDLRKAGVADGDEKRSGD